MQKAKREAAGSFSRRSEVDVVGNGGEEKFVYIEIYVCSDDRRGIGLSWVEAQCEGWISSQGMNERAVVSVGYVNVEISW